MPIHPPSVSSCHRAASGEDAHDSHNGTAGADPSALHLLMPPTPSPTHHAANFPYPFLCPQVDPRHPPSTSSCRRAASGEDVHDSHKTDPPRADTDPLFRTPRRQFSLSFPVPTGRSAISAIHCLALPSSRRRNLRRSPQSSSKDSHISPRRRRFHVEGYQRLSFIYTNYHFFLIFFLYCYKEM